MNNENLSTDFANARVALDKALADVSAAKDTLSAVLDESDKYTTFLEGKYRLLDSVVNYFNTLSESGKNETKAEIISGLEKVFAEVGNV